jgi:hypothetical protein
LKKKTQRGNAATKQAFNPQILQITQILKRINKKIRNLQVAMVWLAKIKEAAYS